MLSELTHFECGRFDGSDVHLDCSAFRDDSERHPIGRPDRRINRVLELLREDSPLRATLLGVIATNVALTKTELTKLAMMANTGAARAINPYHTQSDGDQILAF